MMNEKWKKIVTLAIALMLVFTLFDIGDSSSYQGENYIAQRMLVFIVSLYFLHIKYQERDEKNTLWLFAYLTLAILFNPFTDFGSNDEDFWAWVYLGATAFFSYLFYLFRKNTMPMSNNVQKAYKNNTPSEELAYGLWEFCISMSHVFQQSVIPAIEKAGLKLSRAEKKMAILETIKLNLWIISKTLSSEKSVLEELHHFYAFSMEKDSERKTPETKLEIMDNLIETYKKYYNAWSDETGGSQIILSTEILQQLFNNGEPNKKFLNAFATFPVNHYVLSTMQEVLDLRNNFKIKNDKDK
jgi:hypothetical protein